MARNRKRLLVVGDRVLVKPEEGEERSKVGLYLPPTAVDSQAVQGGEIVATGPGLPMPDPGDSSDEPARFLELIEAQRDASGHIALGACHDPRCERIVGDAWPVDACVERLVARAARESREPEPRGLSALDRSALDAVVEHADNSAPARFYIGKGADRQEIMGLLVAPGDLYGPDGADYARVALSLRDDDIDTVIARLTS